MLTCRAVFRSLQRWAASKASVDFRRRAGGEPLRTSTASAESGAAREMTTKNGSLTYLPGARQGGSCSATLARGRLFSCGSVHERTGQSRGRAGPFRVRGSPPPRAASVPLLARRPVDSAPLSRFFLADPLPGKGAGGAARRRAVRRRPRVRRSGGVVERSLGLGTLGEIAGFHEAAGDLGKLDVLGLRYTCQTPRRRQR